MFLHLFYTFIQIYQLTDGDKVLKTFADLKSNFNPQFIFIWDSFKLPKFLAKYVLYYTLVIMSPYLSLSPWVPLNEYRRHDTQHKDIQLNDAQQKGLFVTRTTTLCYYSECSVSIIVMLSAVVTEQEPSYLCCVAQGGQCK
jgi:hypothetical protein